MNPIVDRFGSTPVWRPNTGTALDRVRKEYEETIGIVELSKSFVDATSGPQNFQLPSGFLVNRNFFIAKVDPTVNNVIILPADGETIEGATSVSMGTQYETRHLTFHGGVWYRL
jgi:hypothetical protein